MCYLEIKNIYKSFNNNKVLDNVSMNISKGSITTIIGNSGNGKTTLLRSLNDLEKIDSGFVYLEGNQIYPKLNKKDKNNFGYIFQSYNLFPQYNVLDNITLGINNRYKYLKKDLNITKKEFYIKNKEKALMLLDSLNLSDKKNNYPFELSGGQSQRVAIARALIMNPDVIFFDEPTSALDPKLRDDFNDIILDLKEKGVTIVIVTHDMSFAREVSDYTYFMSNGKVVEEGRVDILDNPKTKELKEFLGKNKD